MKNQLLPVLARMSGAELLILAAFVVAMVFGGLNLVIRVYLDDQEVTIERLIDKAYRTCFWLDKLEWILFPLNMFKWTNNIQRNIVEEQIPYYVFGPIKQLQDFAGLDNETIDRLSEFLTVLREKYRNAKVHSLLQSGFVKQLAFLENERAWEVAVSQITQSYPTEPDPTSALKNAHNTINFFVKVLGNACPLSLSELRTLTRNQYNASFYYSKKKQWVDNPLSLNLDEIEDFYKKMLEGPLRDQIKSVLRKKRTTPVAVSALGMPEIFLERKKDEVSKAS